MKILIGSLLVLLSISSPVTHGPKFYVNAENGLNIRETPSVNGKVLGKIPYRTCINDSHLLIIDSLKHYAIRNDKIWWYHINYKGIKGFISDDYLSGHDPLKWQASLIESYGANNIVDTSNDNVKGGYNHSNFYWQHINGVDSLAEFIKLEVVNIDDYRKKKVFSLFDVDTTHVYKEVESPDKDQVNTFAPEDCFIVYYENGDSTLFCDDYSKFSMSTDYIGRIPALNRYVIRFSWEIDVHYLVDIQTGVGADKVMPDEASHINTCGRPLISPDHKYVVDICDGFSTDFHDDCSFTLSKFNKDSIQFIPKLTVGFKTWVPDYQNFEAFWVSDRELILRVLPCGEFKTTYWNNDGYYYYYFVDKKPKYIKLTIL